MQKAFRIFVPLLVALLATIPVYAQATLSSTTLSAAIADSKTTTIVVASSTGIVAGTSGLYIDREFIPVTSVSGNFLTGVRGGAGTRATPHASGAVVYFGPANYFRAVTDRAGACVASSELVLPVLNVTNGNRWDCVGGLWVQTGPGQGVERVCYARYDFAVDGGAQGTITPKTNCTIPNNAIITGAVVNSSTATGSTGSATVAVGTSAGSSTTALLGATAIASLSSDALIVGVPVPQTANTWVKLSANGKITVTIATADLNAGVVEVWARYLIASN